MGATFPELGEWFDASLTLPFPGGKKYKIPSPDAGTGLYCEQLMAAGAAAAIAGQKPDAKLLDDDDERTLFERLLGPAYHEMLADGVQWHLIKHAGMTAMFWVTLNEEMALRYWQSGNPGEALAANRTERRAAKQEAKAKAAKPAKAAKVAKAAKTVKVPRAAAAKSTSTAAATTTPKRASGNGTNSPTGSSRAARASTGARSSRTGRS